MTDITSISWIQWNYAAFFINYFILYTNLFCKWRMSCLISIVIIVFIGLQNIHSYVSTTCDCLHKYSQPAVMQLLQQLPSFKIVFGQLNWGHCTSSHSSAGISSRVNAAVEEPWMSKKIEAQIKFHMMRCCNSPTVILVLAENSVTFIPYTPAMTSHDYEYCIPHYSMLQL